MKRSVWNAAGFVLAATVLAGCGKSVPSCGDVEATNLVNDILTGQVLKNTNDLQEELKKRVHFSIEQAVIVDKNDQLHSYACKAVANYKVSDTLLQAIQRATTDKTYETALYAQWRKLIGLYSPDDIATLMKTYEAAPTDAEKTKIRDEIAFAVRADKNASDRDLMVAVLANTAATTKELQKNADLMQQVYALTDPDKKIALNIDYTIAKIDGAQQFKVDVRADRVQVLDGIQNLEVLQSAALMLQNAPAAALTATAQAQPAPAAPQAASSAASAPVPETAAAQPTQQATPSSPAESTSQAEAPEVAAPILASFDCAKAASKIEKLICSTPETAAADKQLSAAYATAKAKATDEKALKSDQLDWIKQQRNTCNDAACLIKTTEARIEKLSAL